MFFRRPQAPPVPSNGFPHDAVVVVIPRVLLDRLLTLLAIVVLLALGGTVQITLHSLNMSVSGASVHSK
jgi:hypothetical protein